MFLPLLDDSATAGNSCFYTLVVVVVLGSLFLLSRNHLISALELFAATSERYTLV